MADGTAPYRTIPEVLRDAAGRDGDGMWIRSDEGSLSFGGALAQTAATARALREAGVRHGDLVMVTLRTTPSYLLCWLALAATGAVTVSANPRSSPAELAGLAHQTRPRALITDAGLGPLIAEAGIAGLPGARCPGRRRADRRLGGRRARGRRACGWRRRGARLAGRRRQPRRSGGPHPDLGHHREVETGHADPPGVRDGG